MRTSAIASTALAALFALVACPAFAGQTGGQYTLQVKLQKQGVITFPIDSIDFGSANNVGSGSNYGSGAGKVQLSPVTITMSTPVAALRELALASVTNEMAQSMTATYRDGTGKELFDVQFKNGIVSSFAFPEVTTSTSPAGDATIAFTVQSEAIVYPAAAAATGGAGSGKAFVTAPRILVQRQVISRIWKVSTITSRPLQGPQFALTIAGCDTSGVSAVGQLAFVTQMTGTGQATGKQQISPLTLTVSVAKASPFTIGKSFSSGQLKYLIGGSTLTVHFTQLIVSSSKFNGSSGEQPATTVVLQFRNEAFSTP